MVKNNVIFSFCLKFAVVFAIVAFLIVLSGAIFNKVEIGVIIKRIVTAEFIFAPMGFLIGFILSNILKNIIFSPDGKISVQTSAKSDDVNGIQTEVVETSNLKEPIKKDMGKNLDIHDAAEDIPMETPMRDYSSSSDTVKSKNGEYIMVNDKKIVNDPKILAEAVKTMINEG